MPARPALALAAALAASAVPQAAAAPTAPPQVTIYRCTDATGRLSLRDSPCRKGERQEVRSMLRPTDAPLQRRVSTSAPRTAPAAAVAPTRVIVVATARPVYECTAPDGARYLSETPEGHPRWVQGWVPAYGYSTVVAPVPGDYAARLEYRGSHGGVRIDSGRRVRGPGTVIAMPYAYPAAGAWVRDPCAALPQGEVCVRLRDRRDALDRRYYSALQGERDAILREERGIDARLAQECGA
ncbi:DUF4124 domain-containing protein [Lysobacter humi (ex Lee et al. 2017)]